MGCLWPKYIIFELNKVWRSYIWWHWRLMQHLIENWLVLSKMTWGIHERFTRTLESLKIETLMGSFHPKYKMYELQIYRVVLFHETEEGREIWRGIDLLVQNWHEEFDEFRPKHWKICTLMGFFRAK